MVPNSSFKPTQWLLRFSGHPDLTIRSIPIPHPGPDVPHDEGAGWRDFPTLAGYQPNHGSGRPNGGVAELGISS